MAKYRKKPVVIEARLLEDNHESIYWAIEFVYSFGMETSVILANATVQKVKDEGGLTIKTLEGDMKASFGDYIIKGVNGEFYPIKADIFKKTYEAEPQPKQLNMTRPLQRMTIERAELTERLDKLTEFLAKDKPMFVEQQQWDLMKNQKIAMDAYHAVLSARIELMSN